MNTRSTLRLVRVRELAASGQAAAVRQRCGLTRGEVSRATGIPVSTLRRWEIGERVPTGDGALRYEAFLRELEQFAGSQNEAS